MLPVTAVITAASGASAKMAMDFEDAMVKVNTIADTTEVPLTELEKAILDLSNQTGISSLEIADNVYNAISAGQKTGDAVNFVSKLKQKIAHGGHPVLRWNIDNIFIRTDPAGNIKADKEKTTEKIDGAIASIMALDRAIRCGNELGDSVYNHRGILFI